MYMKNIPPGGYWRQLPENMVLEAMGGAHESKGGKMGYYRRLSWDCPSPTVVTTPSQKGTLLCHPEELRPITVEEYKRIQGFPDDWKIPGSTIIKYQLIGNAVPVYLSHAIAGQVLRLLEN
jgi:DNA (cytosine-5)-methyltransferase 1